MALRTLFEKWKTSDMPRTEFSREEIDQSPWLNLMSDWHHGYPQPDESRFGYLRATYDLTGYCDRCGIGKLQRDAFQMKGEPKWGKKGILQLNWVFDEYFVTPEVWESVFSPHGVECRPVLDATTGRQLKTVVQLVVRHEVGIVTDDLAKEEAACSKCARTKFLPVTRGAFPALKSVPPGAIARTTAYFGSGASAHQGVVVSQAIGRALAAGKIRGLSFRPVAKGGGV
ncbi:MAG: hypothetical protein ACOY0T_19600 [Myxococcota bacterium]